MQMTSRLRPLSAQLYKGASLHVHKRSHGLPDKLGLVPSTDLMSKMSVAKYAMHVMHHIASPDGGHGHLIQAGFSRVPGRTLYLHTLGPCL